MSSSRAHGHHANTRLFAICTSLIIHLVCPLKLYMRIVFSFSWELCTAQEKLKTKVMQNYRGQTMCNMRNMSLANYCSMALDSNIPRKWKTLNYRHCKPQTIQQTKRISWPKGPHNDDDDIIYLINLTDRKQYVSKLKGEFGRSSCLETHWKLFWALGQDLKPLWRNNVISVTRFTFFVWTEGQSM